MGSGNRFSDNYLDCNSLVLEGVADTDVQNTFFMSMGNIVLVPGGDTSTVLRGLRIVGNVFDPCEHSHGNVSVFLDQRQQKFTDVFDTHIEPGVSRVHESASFKRLVGTRASMKLSKQNTTHFEFDFTDALVFGSIQEVRFSLSLDSTQFARSAA